MHRHITHKTISAKEHIARAWNWLYSQLPKAVIYGYAFLYMYTGYNKLKQVGVFIEGNTYIPYLGKYAKLIGWGIPILELLFASALIIPWLQKQALKGATLLMGVFTLYLLVMVSFVKDKLCKCGGVIESMSWTEHMLFSLMWLEAGIWAIYRMK